MRSKAVRQAGRAVREFNLNGGRQNHSFKHSGQQINAADQDQVIDGACISDYQLHRLPGQFFKRSALFLEIFDRVFVKNAVRFQEAIHLDTR